MRSKKYLAGWAVALLPVLAAAQDLSDLIRSGDVQGAIAAIGAGADVNARQSDGTTPLLWAVYAVDRDLVRELLARGADPNVRNSLGATALTEAVNLADAELVRLLLKAKADPNLGNDYNQTPLMLAASTGSLPIVEMLVKAGAHVNDSEKMRDQTPLMWAIGNGNAAVVDFLIRHKADVNVRAAINDWGNQITSEPRAQYRPSGGMTPLLYATRFGCLECVRLLLKAGADINRPTPDGVTPLMNAIDNLQYGVANFLLDQGANPHLTDWWGRNTLYVALDMRSFGPRFAAGAANQPADGPTPPEHQEPLDLARRLIDMGVNVNAQLDMHRPGRGGNQGRFTDDLLTTGATPLLRAAVAADHDAVELLLQHGAIVDLPNVMGVTPLMAASGVGASLRDTRGSYGSDAQDRALAVLPLLLKAGADVNARIADTSSHTAIIARPSSMTNRQGQTAIFGAINWGWARVAKFLIDNGARLDVKDAAGKTVIDALSGGAGGRDMRASDELKQLITAAMAKKPTGSAPVDSGP
ncbi:MAG TPA: ankyrin repeat domain-containing protein [Steroidobacteraceae bacterium]|nr:ankyrin repeat domain-containing protein [Steroidobacteraceae bacterium]